MDWCCENAKIHGLSCFKLVSHVELRRLMASKRSPEMYRSNRDFESTSSSECGYTCDSALPSSFKDHGKIGHLWGLSGQSPNRDFRARRSGPENRTPRTRTAPQKSPFSKLRMPLVSASRLALRRSTGIRAPPSID